MKHRRPLPELPAELARPLADIEREYIEHVIDACGGNLTSAARVLDVDRTTLARKLRRWHATGQ